MLSTTPFSLKHVFRHTSGHYTVAIFLLLPWPLILRKNKQIKKMTPSKGQIKGKEKLF